MMSIYSPVRIGVRLGLLLFGAAVCVAAPQVEDTQLTDGPAMKLQGIAVPAQQRTINLVTGNVNYNLNVRVVNDPRESNGELPPSLADAVFPLIGDSTVKSTGWAIGVQGRKGAWYSRGTFGFLRGDHSLTKGLPESIVTGTTDQTAYVTKRWSSDEGDITATFAVKEEDDRLFVRIHRDFVGDDFSIRFNALPGHIKAESSMAEERWITTASKNLQQEAEAAEVALPNGDSWMVIFDRSTNQYRGFCAVLFDPQEIKVTSVRIGTTVSLRFSLPPNQTDARFILWDIAERLKSPEDVYDDLKGNQSRLLEELRQFDFASPTQ